MRSRRSARSRAQQGDEASREHVLVRSDSIASTSAGSISRCDSVNDDSSSAARLRPEGRRVLGDNLVDRSQVLLQRFPTSEGRARNDAAVPGRPDSST
jgi:hypothetical protein